MKTGILIFHSETGTEGGYWAFMEGTEFAYENLHILQDGDKLTIYPPNTTPDKFESTAPAWSGEIKLKQFELFTEDALGFWIHADQEGIDRGWWATMFLGEWPAVLNPI